MGEIKQCKRCGKNYYAFPYNAKDRRYCSTTCSNLSNAKKLSKDRQGSGNPRYVHGLNSVNTKGGSIRAQLDKHDCCKLCGKKGVISLKGLVVHHINRNRMDNRINNLMVVCRSCHYNIHFKGGGSSARGTNQTR